MECRFDLGTAVRVCSPCPRLYIAVAVVINTTTHDKIRTWVYSHRIHACNHWTTATRYRLRVKIRQSRRSHYYYYYYYYYWVQRQARSMFLPLAGSPKNSTHGKTGGLCVTHFQCLAAAEKRTRGLPWKRHRTPSVASMACAAGHCSRENPAWLAYAAIGNVVTSDIDLRPFDSKISGFPGLIVKHFFFKFGDRSCIGFWDIVRINRQAAMKTLTPRDCCRLSGKSLRLISSSMHGVC